MKHVLWIGGPPATGKTTIATALACRHGLRLYSADTMTWAHRDRALAAGNVAARRWEVLSPDQRWSESSDTEMFEMSLHRERGSMVLDDIRSLPSELIVIAEGSTVPSWVFSDGIAGPGQALWLLPTREFQRAQLAGAGVTGGRARLYEQLREIIATETYDHQVPTISVDGSTGITEMIERVEGQLADAIAAGPRAQTRQERHQLLRDFNEAIVEQVRGYYRRPWAAGDGEQVVRSFVCECGDPQCRTDVERAVGEAAVGTVLAPEHGSN